MNERKHKSLEELNAFDSFMFNELMNQENKAQAEDFCRTVLEPIVNRKIGKIEVISQRIIQGSDSDRHGIQMDAYIREYADNSSVDVVIEPTIYDIEPNDYKETSEAIWTGPYDVHHQKTVRGRTGYVIIPRR